MNYISNQNGKALKETPAGSRFRENNIEISTLFQNEAASLLCKFLEILFHPLSLVTYSREYYEWFCRLRCHIQIGRLPDQGNWLGLATQSIIWRSMWPTGQTSNDSRINISGEDVPFLVAQVWSCRHSWLEIHFVLLAKIIGYVAFQLRLSYWFVLIETL